MKEYRAFGHLDVDREEAGRSAFRAVPFSPAARSAAKKRCTLSKKYYIIQMNMSQSSCRMASGIG